MKKVLLILLALCLTIPLCAAAADSLPSVSFGAKKGEINGGFEYTLKICVNRAQATDLPVTVRNDQTKETYAVVLPAGQTQASLAVPTEVVTKRQRTTFSLEKSDAYVVGTSHVLTLQPLPIVTFYQNIDFGSLGKTMSVRVNCGNASAILKGNNTFQLRATDGTVLAQREWKPSAKQLIFSFDVEESMLGRQDMTVWLGDYQVSPDPGYGSLADTSEKIIMQLEPSVPLMAIGIDCAYDDSKTDEILAVLDKHHVKVTFFMTGYFMRTFSESAKKILAAGHEIGNHSSTHRHMLTLTPYVQYRQIMNPTEEAEKMFGVTPRLFRPPFGEFNSHMTSVARGEGMEAIMWTMSYCDSSDKYTEERVIEYATTRCDYQPGSIALCHLDGAYQPRSLEAGLTYYESLGLKVVPISALIAASGRNLPPMPAARTPLTYTDDYWPDWLRENVPEYAYVLDAAKEN